MTLARSILLRPYAKADRPAVLALFDANVPAYFAPGERGWLEDSLDDLDGPAFLVTVDGAASAFGGYEIWDYYDCESVGAAWRPDPCYDRPRVIALTCRPSRQHLPLGWM